MHGRSGTALPKHLLVFFLFKVDAHLQPAQTPQTRPQATNTNRDGPTPGIRVDYYPTEKAAAKEGAKTKAEASCATC